ncbi:MAG: DUF6525 family protein [Pseudomonadota bacterium]
MARNLGATTLKRKRRAGDPMAEYDRLPRELRAWVATAILPWRAGSVRAAYEKALAREGDPRRALIKLDRLQHALVTKDAERLWGKGHPQAISRKD